MEENSNLESLDKTKEEKLKGLKIIADQMAQRFFGCDENLELTNLKLTKEEFYKIIFNKNDTNDKIKLNETEAQNQKIINNSKIIDDQIKVNQIQEINSNINTNLNTKENQNTLINTNINTATNINTNPNNNINYDNDNNIYNRYNNNNKKSNKSSFIEESINDDNKNVQNDIQEIDKEKEVSDNIDISIEKISAKLLDNSNDDFNGINLSNNNTLDIPKKSYYSKKTLYERSIINMKKKENKLKKKRQEKLDNIMKEIKSFPGINPYSEELIENKYIPIQERASSIHSLKLFNYIMNEENNKIKEYEKDMIEIKKGKYRNKKFDQNNWDKFIKRQKRWNKNLQYKIKAAILLRDNDENEFYFKPRINEKSKSIIKSLEDESTNYIDDVFSRLYNDFNEHKERQKFRNQQSQPSFKPKIIKCNSQKNLDFNPDIFNKCCSNFSLYLEKKNKTKPSYIMNKSVEENWKEPFIDSCNNFQKKYKNNIDKYEKYINKPTKTNKQSKNNISKTNNSNNSSKLINNNTINSDKKGKSINNSKVPFLPLNIKKMIENNCKEENEKNTNINQINNISEKNNFNHSLYNIEDSKEKEKGQEQLKKNEKKYNESKLEYLSVGTERNNSENSKGYEFYVNNSNSKLSEEKKSSIKSNNKFSEKNESEKIEKNIYKINIMDTTPHIIKQNTVLASQNYYNFFEIQDSDEEINKI